MKTKAKKKSGTVCAKRPAPPDYVAAREIGVPRSHYDAFISHGPGRGCWWAVQLAEVVPADLKPGDRVVFVLDGAPVADLSRLVAVVTDINVPRNVADCRRLKVPDSFIDWVVIRYRPEGRDGGFTRDAENLGEDGRCNYLAQGRRLRGTSIRAERRQLRSYLAHCHPKPLDHSPGAERARVARLMRTAGRPSGAGKAELIDCT